MLPRITIALLGLVACTGQLREKSGSTDLDASPLASIPPPGCSDSTPATDSGDCTGGGNPGDDCLMCHHQGGGGRPFAFAGTLYDRLDAPVTGATITLQDALGNTATALSHSNGNFFTTDGFVSFPAKAFVSICPDVVEMLGPVDELTGANCNTAGCHTSGFRVHLP